MNRHLAPVLGLLLLCACAPPTPAAIPAQLPVDLTGVTMALLRVQPVIVMTNGRAFTLAQKRMMEAGLNRAAKAVAQLSAGMPPDRAAQLAREADAALNETVGILAGVVPFTPGLARWTPLIDAVDAVLPEVERFVGGVGFARARRVPAMTPDQGRQALGIRTVK